MTTIFVSYRRQDSQAHAGRLSDLLKMHFGDSVVFMDVDGISPGEDFVRSIGEQLSRSCVFIPVIGPRWLRVRKGWCRRLFSPDDFVRLEILAALERRIEVIPVLVGGAAMPPANLLPNSIASLASRQAKQVRDSQFRTDVAELAALIEKQVEDSPEMTTASMQAERERVEKIIQADIRETQKRQQRHVRMLIGSLLTVLAIALAIWGASLWRRAEPHFAQSTSTPDPATLRVEHPNDSGKTYEYMRDNNLLRPQSFSRSRGDVEPRLKLSEVLGSRGPAVVVGIEKSGEILFHAVGSTGNQASTKGIQAVADRMRGDFEGGSDSRKPSFLFLLGDVILHFGEAKYYYDQFYSPFRNYPAPILAIAGNHDGIVALGSTTRTLDAFLANFCAETFRKSPDAWELERTAQIEPGVYFTFEAPFVRILALYSNVDEAQGIISSEGGTHPELGDAQLQFLEAALTRIKKESFQGAVIIAVHHDLFGVGAHSGSPTMLSDLDTVSRKTGVWPHIILSGHAHNYQRFTRTVDSTIVQYVGVGTGGARIAPEPAHANNVLPPDRILKSFDPDLGYLRLTVDRKRLHADFQPATGNTSATKDSFTLDLETRKVLEP